jgi:uncharacterized repeat protein (TIGR01451 family)
MKRKKLFLHFLLLINCVHLFSFNSNAQSIGGGYLHSLFLCGDGTVMTYGYNDYGQCGKENSNPWYNPAAKINSLSGIIKVSGGRDYSLFLQSNGSVKGCGRNYPGSLGDGSSTQRNYPVNVIGLTGIIDISAGFWHSLFLKDDNSVWVCGYNYNGQLGNGFNNNVYIPVKIDTLINTIAIAAGYYYSLFLKSDGTVWGTGLNGSGQLGDSTNVSKNKPVKINSLSGIVAIAAGSDHSLFLKNDGTVWATGINYNGELGDSTTTSRNYPMQVHGLTGIVAIACGDQHSLFLKNDGTVWGCGANNNGTLGDGTTTDKILPIQVLGLTGITGISAGYIHSLFKKSDGSVWACGANNYGQLGDGTNLLHDSVIMVSGLSSIGSMDAGYMHSLFLKTDSSVWSCGENIWGEQGDGTTIRIDTPAFVSDLSNITDISASHNYSLFLRNDGTVWGCGSGQAGNLGNAIYNSTKTVIQLDSLSQIVAIAAGSSHSLFLKNDSTVWACGNNNFGSLGDGTTIGRNVPQKIESLTGIVRIAAGSSYSIFLRSNGTVWACGGNFSGQLGDGTSIYRTLPVQVFGLTGITAVAASSGTSLFLKNDGTVWACGDNQYGQLGNGTFTSSNIPIQINTLSGIIAVATFWQHSIFLKNDGTVWQCGNNEYGQIGDGTTTNRNIPTRINSITGITSISAQKYASLFVKYDGTVWRCGYGNFVWNQTSTPLQVQGICQVNSSFPHHITGSLYCDSTNDCTMQSVEKRLPFLPLTAIPGNYYSFANDTGYFSFGLFDSVSYLINPIIPQQYSYMIANPCPSNYSITFGTSAPQDSNGFDFGFDGSLCFQLRTDVSSTVKRRCFRSYTTISYWNEGLIAADSVTVHVHFDQYDIPISSSIPYTIDPLDSSLVFYIGTLNPWQSGTITIVDSVACIPGITGLTQCTKSWILPPNQCLIDSTTGSDWDHSSVSVNGNCINDTVRFVIYNTGEDMATASEYRIYADNVLVFTGSFQITSGDSLVITWVSNGATIRLEADQNPGHPGHSHPQAAIEGCGTDGSGNFSIGQINLVPQDDADIDIEIDCRQIVDSYDPNEKDNAPEGINPAHVILPNTPIDFTIHFQNTGTDTAYKVVVIDSLSNDLDLATLELGVASHPYTTSLSGQGIPVLKFTFNNINLVDSITNELNSTGFIKYKITPKSSTPLGTLINNTAIIYFDYNFPVRTNTAFVTLGTYANVSINENVPTKAGDIIFYPNPTTSSVTLETSPGNLLKKIIVYSLDGRNVKELNPVRSEKVQIDLSALTKGIYFLDCISESSSQKIKIIKF